MYHQMEVLPNNITYTPTSSEYVGSAYLYTNLSALPQSTSVSAIFPGIGNSFVIVDLYTILLGH